MFRLEKNIVAVITSLSLAGCATIVHHGGQQSVSITSTPSDASVSINHAMQLRTPGNITLKRKKDYTVLV